MLLQILSQKEFISSVVNIFLSREENWQEYTRAIFVNLIFHNILITICSASRDHTVANKPVFWGSRHVYESLR